VKPTRSGVRRHSQENAMPTFSKPGLAGSFYELVDGSPGKVREIKNEGLNRN